MPETQREKSGKGIKGTQAFVHSMARQMGHLHTLDSWLDRVDEDEFDLVSIHVRAPREEGEDYLTIVRAWVNGEAKVGFHGADSVVEAVIGICTRISNGTMKWREDGNTTK